MWAKLQNAIFNALTNCWLTQLSAGAFQVDSSEAQVDWIWLRIDYAFPTSPPSEGCWLLQGSIVRSYISILLG